jgi:hypothetical protein
MNSAAWTAGQALPDQVFSKTEPFRMSVYPKKHNKVLLTYFAQ